MFAAHIYQLLALAAVAFVVLGSLNYSTSWATKTTQTENIAWD